MNNSLNNIKHDLRGNKYVGSGEQSGEDCQKLMFVRRCHVHGDIAGVYHNCNNIRCPLCGRKTLRRIVSRKNSKLYGQTGAYTAYIDRKQTVLAPLTSDELDLLAHFRRGISHAVFSLPQTDFINTNTLLAKIRKYIPSFVGYAIIHNERIDKHTVLKRAARNGHDISRGAWSVALEYPDEYLDCRYDGQHVHLIGYLPYVNTQLLHSKTGITFKRIRKGMTEDQTAGVLYYLGTHAPLEPDRQRHTIYHEIGMRMVETAADTTYEDAVCPHCGQQMISHNVETGEDLPATLRVTRYRYRWRDKGAPWVTYPALAP